MARFQLKKFTLFIYGGHFRTCPLGLVEKPGSVDLRMIRRSSKEDQFGNSTNEWLDSDDFPTRWFAVSQTADFVSHLFVLNLFSPYSPRRLFTRRVFYAYLLSSE